MERLTPLSKLKKQEWDHRFAQEGSSKQELPQPVRLKTMNGSAVISTFQHLGTQTKKVLLVKSTSSQSTFSTKDKDRNSCLDQKRSGASAPSIQSHSFNTYLEIDRVELQAIAPNLTVKSILSIEASEKDDKVDINSGDCVNEEEYRRGGYSKPIRATFNYQSTLLEIDISSSNHTLDRDDDEMRKEILDMSYLGLSDNSGEHGGRGFSYPCRGRSDGPNSQAQAKPLCRLEVIGKGSSATIYRAVLLKSLTLCAEKVIIVTDPSKRVQMMSELQSLKKTVRDRNGQSRCENIIGLLDIVSNPSDGTISICLEYMSGK